MCPKAASSASSSASPSNPPPFGSRSASMRTQVRLRIASAATRSSGMGRPRARSQVEPGGPGDDEKARAADACREQEPGGLSGRTTPAVAETAIKPRVATSQPPGGAQLRSVAPTRSTRGRRREVDFEVRGASRVRARVAVGTLQGSLRLAGGVQEATLCDCVGGRSTSMRKRRSIRTHARSARRIRE